MDNTFNQAIEKLKVAIKQDYINWTTQGGKKELKVISRKLLKSSMTVLL